MSPPRSLGGLGRVLSCQKFESNKPVPWIGPWDLLHATENAAQRIFTIKGRMKRKIQRLRELRGHLWGHSMRNATSSPSNWTGVRNARCRVHETHMNVWGLQLFRVRMMSKIYVKTVTLECKNRSPLSRYPEPRTQTHSQHLLFNDPTVCCWYPRSPGSLLTPVCICVVMLWCYTRSPLNILAWPCTMAQAWTEDVQQTSAHTCTLRGR